MLVPPRATLRRPGLTLMELIIVMTILIALAAIIVPLLPGLIGRAERAARATNSQEIYKTIQTFQAAWTKYPNDWDALTDGTTTPLTWLDGTDGVHGNIGLGANGPLAVTQLTGPQTNALRGSGINRLQLFSNTAPVGTNVTFNPYNDLTRCLCRRSARRRPARSPRPRSAAGPRPASRSRTGWRRPRRPPRFCLRRCRLTRSSRLSPPIRRPFPPRCRACRSTIRPSCEHRTCAACRWFASPARCWIRSSSATCGWTRRCGCSAARPG
ncbi:MAG: type II secretion system protein [Gemmataceae bacterium]